MVWGLVQSKVVPAALAGAPAGAVKGKQWRDDVRFAVSPMIRLVLNGRAAGTKVVEVDPRGRLEEVRGIGERPRRIAESVLSAIRTWERRPSTPSSSLDPRLCEGEGPPRRLLLV